MATTTAIPSSSEFVDKDYRPMSSSSSSSKLNPESNLPMYAPPLSSSSSRIDPSSNSSSSATRHYSHSSSSSSNYSHHYHQQPHYPSSHSFHGDASSSMYNSHHGSHHDNVNNNNNNNNNNNGHSNNHNNNFTSPTSPSAPSPISPTGLAPPHQYHHQQSSSSSSSSDQQQHYGPSTTSGPDYDYHPQQGPSHGSSGGGGGYHTHSSSYSSDHHQHPLSPSTDGHYFMGPPSSAPIPKPETSSYSHSYARSHSYSQINEYPESPGASISSASGMTSPGSMEHRGSFAYSSSAPSPSIMRPKRRSEVFSTSESPFFYATQQHHPLLSMDRSMSYNVKIMAKIDRGFFLAANDWTCYRRNYFQLSSSFSIADLDTSIHSEVPCLLDHNGNLETVTRFLICIGAQILNGEKVIDLVQHTPKRDKGPQMTPQLCPVRAGGDLDLAPLGPNPNVITFERVQFKTATANNGKRRAAQQYYQVHVDLYAETDRGEHILVANSFSAPLVVRGRSPGHYADTDDRPSGMAATIPEDRFYRPPNISTGPNVTGNNNNSNGNHNPVSPEYSTFYQPYQYGPYPSLGTATSHMTGHDPNYYDRPGPESYPQSPLSPVGPPYGGNADQMHSGHQYSNYMTPQVSHGSSPESASPDMYSPTGSLQGGNMDQSPNSTFPRHAYHNSGGSSSGGHHPSSQYQGSESGYDHRDHEVQMADLRIHSPTSPTMTSTSSTGSGPRRQSFSSVTGKKSSNSISAGSDRTVPGIQHSARKSRSSSMSGISKRSVSRTRPSKNLPAISTKDHGASIKSSSGYGVSSFAKDRIPESPMEEHHHQQPL